MIKRGEEMKDEKYTSDIALRPLAGTDKITTTTPEEHPDGKRKNKERNQTNT